jgi:glycosyltransferase involved in cell wall biosynthesis
MNGKEREGVKLMIVTPTLECGGSEKFVSLVCNHINTNVFLICVVVVNNAKPFYQIKNPAIEIVDLKKKRVLFSLAALKNAVKNFKPDILFSTANHLNIYLAIFKNHFNKHIQWVAREASIVSITSKQTKMPALYELLIKKYYRRYNCIICQSAYMQQDLVKHYSIPVNKTWVVHNSAENFPGNSIQPVKQQAGQIYKFITVARLSKEKGIERLIHAVGLLTIPFVYYIIGDGNKRHELENLVDELQLSNKIIFVGQKEDAFNDMEDANLLLIGSYYEGLPNALLEAGTHGIPCIAFNVPGGIAEIITPNENGILVDDNDIIGFAAAIKNALVINFERGKIIETTKRRFSVTRMIDAVENIFLELAPNK